MIKRELYLKKLRESYESDLIKVIIGVRRCGKSVLLIQIIEELTKKGIKDNHIIYMNFENYDYIDYTDPKKFNEYVKSKIIDQEKHYLFFDEIQNVNDFERVINSFRATLNVSIFITGSNSKLLSSELATHLAGRYISIKMTPFTFSEFIELHNKNADDKNKKSIKELFEVYLIWGGMPQIYNTDSVLERKLYLKDLYNTIVLKDIVERNNIKDMNLLDRITQSMMENIGSIVSSNSIANYLKGEKINTTVDTVLNYVDYISGSLIFNKVNRYDIRGKKVMSTLEKYYMIDLGFLQLKKSQIEKREGGRLENIIYNELISRGYDVYIGKTEKGEIDFIVNNFGEISYFQVSDYLSSDAVIEREFGAFKTVPDNYPKYVITMDEIDYSQNGIIHINIIKFLLDKDYLK
ncbi:MAG: ATP-binding protein [Bacilli bacterium]|nr:ATP-binding protein [Bacilli bacterium]